MTPFAEKHWTDCVIDEFSQIAEPIKTDYT